ncbi:MAG: hypothetical protein ACKO96_30815, partial [Flammeovirgaceae bacterium]
MGTSDSATIVFLSAQGSGWGGDLGNERCNVRNNLPGPLFVNIVEGFAGGGNNAYKYARQHNKRLSEYTAIKRLIIHSERQ